MRSMTSHTRAHAHVHTPAHERARARSRTRPDAHTLARVRACIHRAHTYTPRIARLVTCTSYYSGIDYSSKKLRKRSFRVQHFVLDFVSCHIVPCFVLSWCCSCCGFCVVRFVRIYKPVLYSNFVSFVSCHKSC